MTDRELLQMALDALELLARYENPSTKVQVRKSRDGGPIVTMYPHKVATEAAVPLRARLAQPEPEPVAWRGSNWSLSPDNYVYRDYDDPLLNIKGENVGEPLYTAPPKKEWVGLTDEEILADDVLRYHFALNGGAGPISKKGMAVIAAVNAKLKEKNSV